ncbi:MAG: fasciclin domain-containing protein [Rhodospirillales bacterium]
MRLKKFLVGIVAVGLAGCASPASKPAPQNIVDTAAGAGNFKTLVAAVQAAGLEGTLRGEGPFTVFAPTDDAFAKLPKGTVDNLLKPENKAQLVKILSYHVVPGKVMSGAAGRAPTSVKTAEGGNVTVTRLLGTHGGVWVNDFAQVTKADVVASNGVIHAVDRVLLPN